MNTYTATPSSITKPDGTKLTTQDPLSWLFHEPEKGCEVVLAAGYYPAPKSALKKTQPSIIRGDTARGATTILPGNTDTIFFADAESCGNLTLRDITIRSAWRSAVMFKASEQPNYFENFVFEYVWIDGGWSFATKSGTASKWGVMGHRTSGFRFTGGGVENIRDEHCFYFHNTGPLKHQITDAKLGPCGRTLVQVVGRLNENGGDPSLSPFELRDIEGMSAGLGDGGHAFTFSGLQNTLILQRVNYQHGFDASLAKYVGTGALVIWPEYGNTPGVGVPNHDVAIVDCRFRMAKGCGKAPLARISACESLTVGNTLFEPGLNPIAVDINPPDGGMAGSLFPVKSVQPLTGNIVLGAVYWNGTKLVLAA